MFARTRLEARQYLTRPTLFKELARDFGGERPARDLLPDHKAAAGLLLALPARAAVGAGVLLDDLARLGAAARARAQLYPNGAELFLIQSSNLLDDLFGEPGDVGHELLPVARPVLDLGEPVLPVAGQL